MAKPSPLYNGDPVLTALGEAIRRARAGVGLSQEALAVDADLDRSYVGGIERGEHNLTVMNIVKIAGALKMSPPPLHLPERGSKEFRLKFFLGQLRFSAEIPFETTV